MEWEAWETLEALARLALCVRSHPADGIARTFRVSQIIQPPPRRSDSTTEPMPFSPRPPRRA